MKKGEEKKEKSVRELGGGDSKTFWMQVSVGDAGDITMGDDQVRGPRKAWGVKKEMEYSCVFAVGYTFRACEVCQKLSKEKK
jgi:hypothetical protein